MKEMPKPSRRQVRFLAVGATCFAVQYGVLTTLAAGGLVRPAANALGFVTSAQLNFLLSSRLTWSDRHAAERRTEWVRLASYNATALISLAVNTAVFTVAYQRLGNLAAAAAGVAAGLCVTYTVCDLVIFRDRGRHRSGNRALPIPQRQPAHRVTTSRGVHGMPPEPVLAGDHGPSVPYWSAP